MAEDLRGDLKDFSVSMDDLISSRQGLIEGIVDKAAGKGFESLFPEGAPADELYDRLKFAASVYMPTTAGKLQDLLKESSTLVASLSKDAAKMMLIAEAAGSEDPSGLGIRLVRKLTFEEARRYYKWQGSLIEARLGSILTGPADPRGYFAIYVPNGHLVARSTFKTTVIQRDYTGNTGRRR